MATKLPKYTKNKMKGNIGESVVQYILSNFALVHKIDGSNDIGNDFICELIRDQYPTNLLFYVQVKYTQDPPRIKQETLAYWKGSPIPVYLFWVRDRAQAHPDAKIDIEHLSRNTEYKRCTPFLHKGNGQENERFRVFNKREFLQDLLIDYSRTQYVKGFTPILKPRDFLPLDEKLEMGLPLHQLHIQDIIPEYSDRILANGWSNLFSLAVVLRRKEDSDSKRKARKVLGVARGLITRQDRKNYRAIIQELENMYTQWTSQGER